MSAIGCLVWPAYEKTGRNILVFSASLVSAVLYLVSVWAMIQAGDVKPKPWWATLVLLFWTVVPPVWFWAEYHFIWKTAYAPKFDNLDVFKYGQELSRNIWLAMAAAVAALYFK